VLGDCDKGEGGVCDKGEGRVCDTGKRIGGVAPVDFRSGREAEESMEVICLGLFFFL